MAKKGDLWDDSVLINAFDDAISKYKMMHGKGNRDSSTEGGKVISSTEENLSALVDESHEAKRNIEADDNSNDVSNTTTEMGETNNLPSVKENHCANSCAPQHYVDSSNGQQAQDALHGYSNTQGAEDYTRLLNQYYELEEQRQKILQQLHQFGSWNYQSSGSNEHWGTGSTSQEHQVPTTQASYPAVICSCCPYACQCLVAPCSLGGTCVGKTCDATSVIGCDGKSFSLEDGDIVKTAMGAADRALSSLKTNSSEKREEKNEGQLTQSAGSETDLTIVLNAWYSAGFFTGKYLVEQSIAKKRQG
uniref:Survival Motor Neuron Gemin2-binding domain-containing protein n=1 Tax=Davidia involucrata TaxID=16924 RepID=A0A5B7B747_DAVIN